MKQAYIPRIERGAHTLSEFTPILREQGEVLYIDTLNWRADFPHRPLVASYLGYDAKALYITYVVDGQDLRTLSPGDGNYVHEDSCVEFFMQREAGEAYNVCHDEETRSIASIAHLVATHVSDDKSKVIFDIPEDVQGFGYAPIVHMFLSSKKLKSLGWKPKVSMAQAYIRLAEYIQEEGL